MKRFMKCNSDLTAFQSDWLHSDEVSTMMKGMSTSEKRMVGRMRNSTDCSQYVRAVIDMIVVMGVDISASFDKFLDKASEVFRA